MWMYSFIFIIYFLKHLFGEHIISIPDDFPIRRMRPFCKTHCEEEETADFWINEAQTTLYEHLSNKPITNVAKNVILFLGDGMSLTTIVAARAYLGLLNNRSGEDISLIFENFPYTGLSKTYCVDKQVADSACSATAYLAGIKNNMGTIGITANVKRGDCQAMANASNYVSSIGKWSQLKGKATGVVTTTRVTHASPAGVYAHTSDRDWESDTLVLETGDDPRVCPDIAYQMVYGDTGKELNVVLGGGRKMFIPTNETDELGHKGRRSDGVNLIEAWKQSKLMPQYVWNRTALLNIPKDTQNLLEAACLIGFNEGSLLLGLSVAHNKIFVGLNFGNHHSWIAYGNLFGSELVHPCSLFNTGHLHFDLDRDEEMEPSLAEMTEAAIKILSKNDNGFFLFVEGGMIDQAHHATYAQKALGDTIAFADAIQKAVDMTSRYDTLIVVTADHAHTLTYNGYADRGNSIFGLAGMGADGLPYSTLSYANGPGSSVDDHGKRRDLQADAMDDKNYRFPVQVPLKTETHDGEDVPVYAVGPWAHLFTGAYEQNLLPHMMAYASCVGTGLTACNNAKLAR